MVRRKAKSEDEKTIDEMADELARETVRGMYKDGKLTPYGKQMAKILDRALPPEKVDEWGWDLPRKEREEIKQRAAEKRRIAEEKRIKRAAARKAKAAAAQKARSATDANVDADAWKKIPLDKVPTDEPGKHNTFFEIAEAYRAQLKKFKKSRCDLNLVNPLIKEVRETTCTWIRRVHPEYVQYFAFQFCEWCRDAMIDQTSDARAKEVLAEMWKKILSPRVYPPWERPLNSPMPRWPRGARRH